MQQDLWMRQYYNSVYCTNICDRKLDGVSILHVQNLLQIVTKSMMVVLTRIFCIPIKIDAEIHKETRHSIIIKLQNGANRLRRYYLKRLLSVSAMSSKYFFQQSKQRNFSFFPLFFVLNLTSLNHIDIG